MSVQDQFNLQVGGGLTWLHRRHRLSCTETAILSALILLDRPAGCSPQQTTIAEVSGRPLSTVRVGIRKLEAKGLIETIYEEHTDDWGRVVAKKNATYVFSEEIEQALQFSAETIELKRRSTQPRLMPSPPDDIDHLLAEDGRTSLIDAEPAPKLPLTPEQQIAVDLLTDPLIALPTGQAEIYARGDLTAWEILAHCVFYREDLDAGKVDGIGVLIYRLRENQVPRVLTEVELQHDLVKRYAWWLEQIYYIRDDPADAALTFEHIASGQGGDPMGWDIMRVLARFPELPAPADAREMITSALQMRAK